MPEIYGTLEGFKTYHTERGNSYTAFEDEAISAALLRASEYIDGRYRRKFPGEKTGFRSQVREWPRAGSLDGFGYVADIYGNDIASDEIPDEVVKATYEIALRECGQPGIMQPDVRRSDRKLSVAVSGAVSVTYANATSIESYRLTVTIVDAILAPILTGEGASTGLSGRTLRV